MEISTNFSIAQKSTETVPENFLTGKFGEISVFYAFILTYERNYMSNKGQKMLW